MPYEREIEQLAKGALAAHGQLQEVVFLEANKDSLLVFSDGTVIPVLHQQHGYDIRGEAYAMQLARDHSGTDYFSLLAFGYSGTGPSCYAVFLRTAGFQSTKVEKLSAPLKLRLNGSTIQGTEHGGSIEWADGSQTPAPGRSGRPKPATTTPERKETFPAAAALQVAPTRMGFWDRLFGKKADPVPRATVSPTRPVQRPSNVPQQQTAPWRASNGETVQFNKKYSKQPSPSGTTKTYEEWTAPSTLAAQEYLNTRTIGDQRYYLVVETPDGHWGKDIGGPYLEECGSGSVFGITEPDKLWLKTEMYFDCPKCGHSARINNVGKTSFQGNPSSFRNTPCSKCGQTFDAGPRVKFGQCPGFDYSTL